MAYARAGEPTKRVAIYARKSKFDEKSESIAAQVDLCREYCERVYPGWETIVFDEDEGFSGKNTNRPSFQRMWEELKAGRFGALCVYRLDRLGRNIKDFCEMLEEIQSHRVAFVSVRDQFDTSSPMGRAMMYIASVFSQLEREVLAERVRDGMYRMARTGRWLGGRAPTGLKAVWVTEEIGGVMRKKHMLQEVPQEMAQVTEIYQKYVETGSISAVLTWTMIHRIKSPNGTDYSRMTIRRLLENPVYCTADKAAWDYFSKGNFALYATKDEFDGAVAVMPFNRTEKLDNLTVTKPTTEWIIAVGTHRGAVSGAVWVEAQKLLREAKHKGQGWQAPRTENALLSGLIRCEKCGSFMRPKAYGPYQKDGKRKFSYICYKKQESRSALCKIENAPYDVDGMVIDEMRAMSEKYSEMLKNPTELMKKETEEREDKRDRLIKQLAEAEKKMEGLLDALEECASRPEPRKRIYARMDAAEDEINRIKEAIGALTVEEMQENSNRMDMQLVAEILGRFGENFEKLSHHEKRTALKAAIECVWWDGESIEIVPRGGKWNDDGTGNVGVGGWVLPKCNDGKTSTYTTATHEKQSVHRMKMAKKPTATMEERMRYALAEARKSIGQVAEEIGMHRGGLECSIKAPEKMRADRLAAFAKATDTAMGWLIYGEEEPQHAALTGDTYRERITCLMMQSGMSLRAFGRSIGDKHATTVRSWTRDGCIPSVQSLMRIAEAHGINAADLIPKEWRRMKKKAGE